MYYADPHRILYDNLRANRRGWELRLIRVGVVGPPNAKEAVGGKVRKYYRATPLGEQTLGEVRAKVEELVAEVLPCQSLPIQYCGRLR